MSHLLLVKSTGIYRCPDEITHLKLRIKMTETTDTNLLSASEMDDDDNEWISKTFEWQQKIFSNFEKEIYKNENNCLTDLEKKYHNEVQKLAENQEKFAVYSYINDDEFVASSTNNKDRYQVFDANYAEFDAINNEMKSTLNEFNFMNSLQKSIQNPSVDFNNSRDIETMLLMADLGNYFDETWIRNEKILCEIKFNKNTKILTVFPDLTTTRPYLLQTQDDVTRNYFYYIENVSDLMPETVQSQENEFLKKVTNQKLAIKKQLIETNYFELPSKDKLQVFLFIEILSGKNFEYSDLYVQYFIDLPRNWVCKNPEMLQGITQTCHIGNYDRNFAHFGHVVELVLEFNVVEISGILENPYIYFEVISKDNWSRYRTEGLTYKNLPISNPGTYSYQLQCFRLCPDGLSAKLRRFFIGDCSNYSDLTWIGIPSEHQGTVLNKYGTSTIGTGQLSLRINVLHQSQAFLREHRLEEPGKIRERLIIDKLNASRLIKSVEEVVEAFKKARRNMIETRKNV